MADTAIHPTEKVGGTGAAGTGWAKHGFAPDPTSISPAFNRFTLQSITFGGITSLTP
jgi:hypothetical protein